jgi:NodT family efflux transporter outer membrane factor (OMF) lipoprotein
VSTALASCGRACGLRKKLNADRAVALSALMLAGCAVGPNFHAPAAPTVTGYTARPLPAETTGAPGVPAGAPQRFVGGLDIPGQWWDLFHSKPLDGLIAEALQSSPDLAAAEAALRQANENVYAGQGALFPTASANLQAERQALSAAEFGQPSGKSFTFNLVTPTLTVTYPLDVFGGVRRQVESLAATAEYQRFELEAAYLTLTSNVVVAAIDDASLRGQIAATEDIIRIESDQLAVVQQQFDLGAVAKSEVLSQQATLAATRATLPPLRKQLAVTRDRLTALIGRFPSQEPTARFALADLKLPEQLPVSLPSALVSHRPDVRAAEATLHAASADIGVAIANQLPQFTITGQFGSAAFGFSSLFTPATTIWSAAGSVAQTLFDAGTLLHKRRAAVAAFDQAAAQYRGTVLSAFQNVADSLHALQADADALRAEAEAEKTAGASLDLAQRQFQFGAISYPTLLDAQKTYQQAHINLVQAEATRLADTAGLFQALGGGWWHRGDVTQAAKGSPDRFWLPGEAARK